MVDPKKKKVKTGPLVYSDERKIVVKSLLDSGRSVEEAADAMGMCRKTVQDINKYFDADPKLVHHYRTNRAKILAKLQADELMLQAQIRESITPEEIKNMTPGQRVSWFNALTISHGTKYDKERIERGESTENVAVLVKQIKELKAQEDEKGG